ncbi:bifunctional diaminohydroxyphosphoribosylaminopyrimidine deaminase/5-amino-6-(5-phosphoribosylamino)uracil reductase RibD [Novispirillum itersonii]|uniref:Riboflavin biosynthesis protein RibD n=1 Tax=Novispirillum itersonii TaxID=189 RepID=A0A7W9ZH96_NOVIT|nr:bifunctional diaminohydroxyphosphoribosylaminopyrimidine deaminase/5-amino-6-(5-phosphoribosylamino)uracil reductase RibD [Novispirillum itersonii]MBB6210069.1 diaminohydroxyphosphoribosylaminopyrimidine deaminase/5-amino-6-(5-phosphoribosylamino)uracil reductase [Novispirillum itersonii]
MSNFSDSDRAHMAAALRLSRRGLGNTWPNPAVGCVIVRDGLVVGRGWTQPGGRPHAEVMALRQAGEKARGATAYVTLEPCSHFGKTPPCADALVEAGISRCVSALTDSDPRVSGRGLERLRAAGILVQNGLLADQARAHNLGFFLRVEQGRPLFTLKTATSLDGRIALANGTSQWITGPEARALTHRLRAEHDAVLVGSGTVLADDPDLRCRLPGVDPRPVVRVVLDARLRMPPDAALVRSAAEAPVWVVTSDAALKAEPAKVNQLTIAGIEILPLSDPHDCHAVAAALGARGLTRVMIEGGGQVAGSFLQAGLIDRAVWFRAPKILGGDARTGIGALGLTRLSDSPQYRRVRLVTAGEDSVEFLERKI